ncbi:MAG: hypothetical protein LBS99_02625 [Clostridiales bacterium]|jgi:hypothetical protein|nr:hypothetical protein [Clostridiales bacterium]
MQSKISSSNNTQATGFSQTIIRTAAITLAATLVICAAAVTILIFASPKAAFFLSDKVKSYNGMVWARERAFERAESDYNKSGGAEDYGTYISALSDAVNITVESFDHYLDNKDDKRAASVADKLVKYSDMYLGDAGRAGFETDYNRAALLAAPRELHPYINNYSSYIANARMRAFLFLGRDTDGYGYLGQPYIAAINDGLSLTEIADGFFINGAYGAAIEYKLKAAGVTFSGNGITEYGDIAGLAGLMEAVENMKPAYFAASDKLAALLDSSPYSSLSGAQLLTACELARMMALDTHNSYLLAAASGADYLGWLTVSNDWLGRFNDLLDAYMA